MNNTKKLTGLKFLNIILCSFIVTLSLTACGSPQSKIVGHWVNEESKYWFDEIEFFSDGTYASDDANYDGKYSIDGNRLKITGILVSDRTYTFEIKGNNLTLTRDDKSETFIKATH